MPIQTKPNPPMTMNAISQPLPTPMLWKYRAKEGMVTGAIKAPTVAPALKMEVENARSFFGKYSAVTLIAAGKFPASPTLNITRAAMKK